MFVDGIHIGEFDNLIIFINSVLAEEGIDEDISFEWRNVKSCQDIPSV